MLVGADAAVADGLDIRLLVEVGIDVVALEHLHGGASARIPGDAESAQAWVRTQVSRIDQGLEMLERSLGRRHLRAGWVAADDAFGRRP